MKHENTNQEFLFNEILFQHRNKEYGAYALRNESDKILTKSLFIGVSLLAVISITPMVITAFKTTEKPIPIEPIYRPINVLPNDPPKKDPPAQIVKPVTPPNTKTYDSAVKIPSKNADEKDIKTEIPVDAVPGFKNDFKADPAKTDYVPTTPTIKTGPVVHYVPTSPPVVPKVVDNTIKTSVDVEANFEGGINAFREKVMSKFDTSGLEDGEVIKTTLTFIVEKDGTISGVKADGKDVNFNNEALRTIKSIKGKWIPAKIKGEPVRSYFRFPISMKFDN